jgi:hypothetical protein
MFNFRFCYTRFICYTWPRAIIDTDDQKFILLDSIIESYNENKMLVNYNVLDLT